MLGIPAPEVYASLEELDVKRALCEQVPGEVHVKERHRYLDRGLADSIRGNNFRMVAARERRRDPAHMDQIAPC